MVVELATAMWPAEMIYESTATAMGFPDALAPAALWSVETTDDLSPTRMRMLDPLVEVVAP